MSKNGVCRLCLEVILDDDFKTFDNATGKMLQCVPLTLDTSITKDPVVCSTCVKNLQMLFEFKTSCLSNNNYLKTYDAVKMSLVNLVGRKADPDVTDNEENICRFCLGYFERNFFVELNNVEQDVFLKDMLDKCLSEIDLNITKNPLMCKDCMESLENQFNFMMSCLDNEAKINYFLSFGKQDNLNDILEHMKSLENGNVTEECSKITLDGSTNTEGEKPEDVQDCVFLPKVQTIKEGYQEVIPVSASVSSGNGRNKNVKCSICPFRTTTKHNLRRHSIMHKDPLTISLHKCDRCDYSTKWKCNLKTHCLRHDNPAPLYKCHICSRVLKTKTNLQLHYAAHSTLHKDLSTISLYKCDRCDYFTNRKSDLKKHCLRHDNPARTYKCHVCSLVVKTKANLHSHYATHSIIHNDLLTMLLHRCDRCDYFTNQKGDLTKHRLKHDNPAPEYKCHVCSIVVKTRANLRIHSIVHKDPATILLHKCDRCDYSTKWKGDLKSHSLRHHKPAPA